jgi:hypothetical protein
VIIQLTALGKLDVEVDRLRAKELVCKDSVRNFVIAPNLSVIGSSCLTDQEIPLGSVWPSSNSLDHESKRLWSNWLMSKGLEKEDILCKLMLLDSFCRVNSIRLLVFQGYQIDWKFDQLSMIERIIKNHDSSFMSEYRQSASYQQHDHSNNNTVPCFSHQISIALTISQYMEPEFHQKIARLREKYHQDV